MVAVVIVFVALKLVLTLTFTNIYLKNKIVLNVYDNNYSRKINTNLTFVSKCASKSVFIRNERLIHGKSKGPIFFVVAIYP